MRFCRFASISFKRLMSTSYSQERATELRSNIEGVLKEIASSSGTRNGNPPRLVPISKLKPASDIQALYDAGHRHFGENYIQELVDKSQMLPNDIKWHFVGSVQSNKAKLLASVNNLFVLETLSSIKVADILEKSLPSNRSEPLNVYLQINTSGEDAKSGLDPLDESSGINAAAVQLALHVVRFCPQLRLFGLMTIGSWHASHDADRPNPDFASLKQTREQLVKLLKHEGIELSGLELSMGMSADFAQAIKEGSDSVRVGTRIFGERPSRNA